MNWIRERYDESLCHECGAKADTPALRALHRETHREEFGVCGLRQIPFSLFPAIAAVMEEFAAERVREALAVKRRRDRSYGG